MQHGCNTNYTNETLARHEQHKCDMRAAPVRRDKRDTSAAQVKKFDFDNDTSEKIFSFYERFSFFLKKKLIILDFVNFPPKNTPWMKTTRSYQ